MIVTVLISIGVKTQAPQVSFKLVAGDSMAVSSHEFSYMKYCDFMNILKDRSDYRAHTFSLLGLISSPHMITCSSPHSKDGDLLHSLGHLLLTFGAQFTSHGSMFKDEPSQLLGFTSHGLNSQALFLFCQTILVSLHGPIIYYATAYVLDSVDQIHVLLKKKIPPNIII